VEAGELISYGPNVQEMCRQSARLIRKALNGEPQALHRVRERLVSQRTRIINQIRAFLLERGVAVRQGLRFLRIELPGILAGPSDALSPRMVRVLEDLAGDWRRLDERIEGLSNEIEAIAYQGAGPASAPSFPARSCKAQAKGRACRRIRVPRLAAACRGPFALACRPLSRYLCN
jgi:hypothetical protein